MRRGIATCWRRLPRRWLVATRSRSSIFGCGARVEPPRVRGGLSSVRQQWTLVDSDPLLLAAARERLTAWAESAERQGEQLLLTREGRTIAVSFRLADLRAGIEPIVAPSTDLVTAAALFDLVSANWISELVSRWLPAACRSTPRSPTTAPRSGLRDTPTTSGAPRISVTSASRQGIRPVGGARRGPNLAAALRGRPVPLTASRQSVAARRPLQNAP